MAISLNAALAWYVTLGVCPVVNRPDPERYRGPLLIQVSQRWDESQRVDLQLMAKAAGWTGVVPTAAELRDACGCIVGMVEMVDCVETHPSPFFTGRYGHVYANARMFREPWTHYPGKLGLFDVPETHVPAGAGGGRPAGSVALDFATQSAGDRSAPLPSDPLQRRMF